MAVRLHLLVAWMPSDTALPTKAWEQLSQLLGRVRPRGQKEMRGPGEPGKEGLRWTLRKGGPQQQIGLSHTREQRLGQ